MSDDYDFVDRPHAREAWYRDIPVYRRGYLTPMLVVVAGVTLCLALLGGVLYGAVESEQEWVTFKVEHHCKITGHDSGEFFNTFDMKGNVGVGVVPSKTSYLCDDGVTYTR
jgi:hypothetical protein